MHINTFGGASSTNTYAVGLVSIITDDGVVTVDTLITDVIVTPIDRRNWSESLKSTQVTKLQLAYDLTQDYFPVQVVIGLDSVWQFLKPDVIYGYPTAQASSLGYLLSGWLFPVEKTAGESPSVTQCFANNQSYHSQLGDGSGMTLLVRRILKSTTKLLISLESRLWGLTNTVTPVKTMIS